MLKAAVFLLCVSPIIYTVWRGLSDGLGANPIEYITHFTGDWTLRFLVFTVAITPLRKILGLPDLIKFRRLIGLFAFFYGCLHFTTYIWMDKLLALEKGMTQREVASLLGKPMPGWTAKKPRAEATIEAWYYRTRGGGVAGCWR